MPDDLRLYAQSIGTFGQKLRICVSRYRIILIIIIIIAFVICFSNIILVRLQSLVFERILTLRRLHVVPIMSSFVDCNTPPFRRVTMTAEV